MFIDQTKIWVEAGAGGNGCVAFRREKFVPKGGPAGGDGGKGGSVIFRVRPGMSTLAPFRHQQHFRAKRGGHGEGSQRHGRGAEDLLVDVPPGTMVMNDDRTQILADLTSETDTWVAAKGGKGGRGNARFATSTRQAPRISEDGQRGESRWLRLELRVLADVGLVGFPNGGKSTLISRISQARPRVADYPFTTMEPVLGVVEIGFDTSFVVADIPGIIEGAHAGHGLGTRFLRHLERTRALVHVVDLSPDTGRDPLSDLEVIDTELRAYSPTLAERPCLVALNKIDLAPDADLLRRLREQAEAAGHRCLEISAFTGAGVAELVAAMIEALADAPPREEQ